MAKTREEKRGEEHVFSPRIGVRFEYGSLLNKAVATLIDSVQLSMDSMKRDLTRLYGEDIAALALYSEDPVVSWRIGLLIMRDIIISRHGGEKIELSPITKGFIAMAIAGRPRRPGLRIPLSSGSEVESFD